MYKENGKGMVKMIISIIVIVALVILAYFYWNNIKTKKKSDDVRSNMLLIQGTCSVLKENITITKQETNYVGTKLSEMDDEIINEFKNKHIIEESDYEKFYALKNEDLQKFNLNFRNEKNAYYLINYETDEVIITNSYNGKYKLSELQ